MAPLGFSSVSRHHSREIVCTEEGQVLLPGPGHLLTPAVLKAGHTRRCLAIASAALAALLGLGAVAATAASAATRGLAEGPRGAGAGGLGGRTVGLSKIFSRGGVNYTMHCGRTFELKKVLHNNLGDKGPDHGREGIIWLAEEMSDGESRGDMHIEVHAISKYRPSNAKKNGMHGSFGWINMPTGEEVRLKFEFKTTDGKPRTVDEAVFTFYDLDQAKKSSSLSMHALLDLGKGIAGREWIRVYGSNAHLTTLASETQIRMVHHHDHTLYMSTQVGTGADNPSDPKHLTELQKQRAVAFTYKNVKDVTVELGSTDGSAFRTFEFALLNAMNCKAVVVPRDVPRDEPMGMKLVVAAAGGLLCLTVLCLLVAAAWRRLRPLTPEEQRAKIKENLENIAKRVEELLAKEPVNYGDPELVAAVAKLKAHKQYVKASTCGAPWKDWSAVGACEVCRRLVDKKEKGLHCANGGHRLCWKCMMGAIDWDKLCDAGKQAGRK